MNTGLLIALAVLAAVFLLGSRFAKRIAFVRVKAQKPQETTHTFVDFDRMRRDGEK